MVVVCCRLIRATDRSWRPQPRICFSPCSAKSRGWSLAAHPTRKWCNGCRRPSWHSSGMRPLAVLPPLGRRGHVLSLWASPRHYPRRTAPPSKKPCRFGSQRWTRQHQREWHPPALPRAVAVTRSIKVRPRWRLPLPPSPHPPPTAPPIVAARRLRRPPHRRWDRESPRRPFSSVMRTILVFLLSPRPSRLACPRVPPPCSFLPPVRRFVIFPPRI